MNEYIQKILPELVNIRRKIHACPELGYEEFKTSETIVSFLETLPGVEVKKGIAGTGVIAILGRNKSAHAVALRADMDALPIEEQTGLPYASTNPGKMHACGHDGHVTMLLGAAATLSNYQESLKGPVVFVFQPAEEGGFGGRGIMQSGILQSLNVRGMFGIHGWPTEGLNKICTRPGPFMAASNSFTATVKGRSCHAAQPHFGIDAVYVGAQIVNALQSIVSRGVDPNDSVVVSIGKFHSGSAFNVIADSAKLEGIIRTLTPETRIFATNRVREIIQDVAKMYGAEVELEEIESYPAVINHYSQTAYVKTIAEKVVGAQNVDGDFSPSMGAEDFAYYLEEIPGAYYFLGLNPGEPGSYPVLHNPKFDFNDEAIPTGIRMHCEIALSFN